MKSHIFGNLVAWAFFASLFGSTNAAAALGWSLLALAGLGLASPLIARTRPSLGWSRWVVLGVVGAALAAPYDLENGPVTIPMPSATFAGTPLRANTRFFLLAQLGLAGRAAEAVALPWRVPRLRVPRGVVAVLAAGLVAVVSIPRARHFMDPPLTRLEVGSRVPAVHRWLAAHGDGPVLEPPGPGAANWLKQADTMIAGMAHWVPLLGWRIALTSGACLPSGTSWPPSWSRRLLRSRRMCGRWRWIFAVGGIYVAVEETLEDSLCAELVSEQHHGMAFGTLATVNGVGDFLSSAVVGALWTWAGTTPAFLYCAVLFSAGALAVLRIDSVEH